MDLKQRLGTLRRQAGTPPGGSSVPGIAERVQRYRVDGRKHGNRPVSTEALALQLDGKPIDDGVILIERCVPLSEYHGRICLADVFDTDDALPEARGFDLRSAVFLDTETSGLAGGTGTVVFLLGLAKVESGHLVIRQYHLTRFSAEARMLDLAGEWLRNADGVVTFNGKCFDIPLLATRYRLCALHDPTARLAHLDLLHPTRRAFASRWSDCRLVSAERKLLRFEREDDVPGSLAPLAWFAWLQRNDPEGLVGIARHNHWDVLSLAALIPALAGAHAAPGAWEADVLAIARAYLSRNQDDQALALLCEHRAMLDDAGLLELARLYRRHGRWPEACTIWEPLAERGSEEAIERLAKYHEHIRGDCLTALDYAARLAILPEHEQRRERLRHKLAARQHPAGSMLIP